MYIRRRTRVAASYKRTVARAAQLNAEQTSHQEPPVNRRVPTAFVSFARALGMRRRSYHSILPSEDHRDNSVPGRSPDSQRFRGTAGLPGVAPVTEDAEGAFYAVPPSLTVAGAVTESHRLPFSPGPRRICA